jgi:hypothetical protein
VTQAVAGHQGAWRSRARTSEPERTGLEQPVPVRLVTQLPRQRAGTNAADRARTTRRVEKHDVEVLLVYGAVRHCGALRCDRPMGFRGALRRNATQRLSEQHVNLHAMHVVLLKHVNLAPDLDASSVKVTRAGRPRREPASPSYHIHPARRAQPRPTLRCRRHRRRLGVTRRARRARPGQPSDRAPPAAFPPSRTWGEKESLSAFPHLWPRAAAQRQAHSTSQPQKHVALVEKHLTPHPHCRACMRRCPQCPACAIAPRCW